MVEDDIPGGLPVAAAAPVAQRQWPWVAFFAAFGAVLFARDWASPCVARPLDTFLQDQARVLGYFLVIFAVGALANKRFLHGLRASLYLVPMYLVGLVPPALAIAAGWEGGWILGIAGAAAGAAGGAAAGWLMIGWTLPDIEKNPPNERARAILLPGAFTALFVLFGAYHWAHESPTPDWAWAIAIGWILLAIPGALVGRPFLGLLVASPLMLLMLVPLVASLTVGWEGGWILGIAGAATGALLGVVKGWLFNRWIMPEYDKRRARKSAAGPPGATDGTGSSASMADLGADPFICPTCTTPMKKESLYCQRCGTVKWLDTVGTLAAGLLLVGPGALALWGSTHISSDVASWLVYFLGAAILAISAGTYVTIVTDIGRARQLALSWRRAGSLPRAHGNGDRPC